VVLAKDTTMVRTLTNEELQKYLYFWGHQSAEMISIPRRLVEVARLKHGDLCEIIIWNRITGYWEGFRRRLYKSLHAITVGYIPVYMINALGIVPPVDVEIFFMKEVVRVIRPIYEYRGTYKFFLPRQIAEKLKIKKKDMRKVTLRHGEMTVSGSIPLYRYKETKFRIFIPHEVRKALAWKGCEYRWIGIKKVS